MISGCVKFHFPVHRRSKIETYTPYQKQILLNLMSKAYFEDINNVWFVAIRVIGMFTAARAKTIHSLRKLLVLTFSWQRPVSYRNQSIDLLCKSTDWFLYDNGLRHERVKWYSLSDAGLSLFVKFGLVFILY